MDPDWRPGQTGWNLDDDAESHDDTFKSAHDIGAIRAVPAREVSPPFTHEDSTAISAWLDRMARPGMFAEMTTSHAFLAEALHIVMLFPEERSWLIHKTPRGAAAVREWPGLATVVPGIADALSLLSDCFSSEKSCRGS